MELSFSKGNDDGGAYSSCEGYDYGWSLVAVKVKIIVWSLATVKVMIMGGASRPKGRGFEPHRRHCVVVLGQDTFILA